MRIAHLCSTFSPLSQTFIYDYITELERQGVDNHVVTMERLNAAMRPFPKVIEVPFGKRWHPRRLWHRLRTPAGQNAGITSYWPQLRERLREALAALSPDLMHAHFGPMGVLIAPVAQQLQIPLVVSFHGIDAFRVPLYPFWHRQYQQLWRSAAALTVVSEYMHTHLQSLGSKAPNTHVVHVGKRMEDYPFRTEPHHPIRRWISVGRLVEKKGFLDLLEAFRQVAHTIPALTLEIIGDGPQEILLKERVAALGLTRQVLLSGAVPHVEVKQRMRNADVFILCSKTASDGDMEGIPTVLMEAQALGLPCVSTQHSGIPEVFPAQNHHLLAQEGHLEEIANCMQALLASSPHELSVLMQAGRKQVAKDFNLTIEVEKLRRLYQSVA